MIDEELTLLARVVIFLGKTSVGEDDPFADYLTDGDLIDSTAYGERQCSDQTAFNPIPHFYRTIIRCSDNLHRIGWMVEQSSDRSCMAVLAMSNSGKTLIGRRNCRMDMN